MATSKKIWIRIDRQTDRQTDGPCTFNTHDDTIKLHMFETAFKPLNHSSFCYCLEPLLTQFHRCLFCGVMVPFQERMVVVLSLMELFQIFSDFCFHVQIIPAMFESTVRPQEESLLITWNCADHLLHLSNVSNQLCSLNHWSSFFCLWIFLNPRIYTDTLKMNLNKTYDQNLPFYETYRLFCFHPPC